MKKFLVLIVFLLLLTIAEDSSVSFSTSYLPNSYSTDPGGGDEKWRPSTYPFFLI